MLIVDSQIHIWENGLPTNPAHRQIPVYSKDDALRDMDAAHVLGHGHHADAVLLAAVCDHVHGRAVVADRARQGADHGTGPL